MFARTTAAKRNRDQTIKDTSQALIPFSTDGHVDKGLIFSRVAKQRGFYVQHDASDRRYMARAFSLSLLHTTFSSPAHFRIVTQREYHIYLYVSACTEY